MLNLVLFGPPGSGKGTQAEKLREKYKVLHLSTGEMIRNEIKKGSEIGKTAARQMVGGELASDEIVCNIIDTFLKEQSNAKGVVYDGFPRTLSQAEAFDRILESNDQSLTLMIALDVPDDEVLRRVKSRAQVSGRDDDSNDKVTRNRIDIYNSQAAVVTKYYAAQGKYHRVDGMGSIDEIFMRICDVIDSVWGR